MRNQYKLWQIKRSNHFKKADIHIHSNYSDGRSVIKEILDYVGKKLTLMLSLLLTTTQSKER